jgi:type II secretory pathway pseudopilin PulG
MTERAHDRRRPLRDQRGFTMLIVLGVLLVTSILLTAAFTTAIGDSHLSREDTNQKQAYYAALAGIQEYLDELQRNPDYWETCETPGGAVPGESSTQSYKIELLVASTAEGATECSTANPFKTMIESKGTLTNTFRIKSTGSVTTTGYAASATRSLVATFQVSGFLNYIYYTNYEQGDPALFGSNKECEKKYYSEWSLEHKLACTTITFVGGDAVNGPMHTNDSAKVMGAASFGRAGQKPPDPVEINGGVYTSVGTAPLTGCGGLTATFNTASGCFSTKGATLVPPETDTSLALYVEPQNEFTGATHLELLGSKNEIAVTYYEENAKEELVKKEKTMEWPKNGLIYVKSSSTHGCAYEYKYWKSDTKAEEEEEKACGNVYVKGTFTKSLTVAGENDLIINGSIVPNGIALGAEPTGTPVVGLIASHYVRVWHPVTGPDSTGGCGTAKNSESFEPWIYAAILATSHSFVVDNYNCGAEEGKLNVYGAIAQNYRGPVGTTAGPTGYIKDYKFDGRLAVDEPPYFLSPFKSGWKVIRETAPTPG